MRAGRLREKNPPGRCAARHAPANSLSRSSAACCEGKSGSGRYDSNDACSNCGGGVSSEAISAPEIVGLRSTMRTRVLLGAEVMLVELPYCIG